MEAMRFATVLGADLHIVSAFEPIRGAKDSSPSDAAVEHQCVQAARETVEPPDRPSAPPHPQHLAPNASEPVSALARPGATRACPRSPPPQTPVDPCSMGSRAHLAYRRWDSVLIARRGTIEAAA